MGAFNDIYDYLYNLDDEIGEFNPKTSKSKCIIDNEEYNGYSFITPQNKNAFVFRTNSNYHDNGTQWGNPWCLYSITDNKFLIIGRKAKKQIIKEAKRF